MKEIAYIRLFTSVIPIKDRTFRVLVATSAANMGIDQPLCVYVLRVGLPRCPTTLIQERGHLVQNEGMTGTFLITSCWGHSLILMISVLSSTLSATEEVPDHIYASLVIESHHPRDRSALPIPIHLLPSRDA